MIQAFGFLFITNFIKSQPECVYYRPSPQSFTQISLKVTTPIKGQKNLQKEFRIQNSNQKRSPTANYLTLPTSKTRVTLSDRHSKEADESEGSLPHSKNGSERPAARSDRAFILTDEKSKMENKLTVKPNRRRIASSVYQPETHTAKELTPLTPSGMNTTNSRAELLRKSASCVKGFSSLELPPLPTKTGKKQGKQSQHRFTPTAKADIFKTLQ